MAGILHFKKLFSQKLRGGGNPAVAMSAFSV